MDADISGRPVIALLETKGSSGIRRQTATTWRPRCAIHTGIEGAPVTAARLSRTYAWHSVAGIIIDGLMLTVLI